MSTLFGSTVYAYTRKQAIADGVLIDVMSFAANCEITIPTAITGTLFYSALVPQGIAEQYGETTNGRLADLFLLFKLKAQTAKNQNCVAYPFLFTNEDGALEELCAKAIILGGDKSEPVLTFMLPTED